MAVPATAAVFFLLFLRAAAGASLPECPLPPQPACYRPPSIPEPLLPCSAFENARLYNAYLVIQRFKATISCDPQGITRTWTGADVCAYIGFACATFPGTTDRTVFGVDFNGFALSAPTLVGFPDQLPDLTFFHANSNNFTDTVPDLTRLRFLFELDLSNNLLAGPVPPHVGGLAQVVFLDLRFNKFEGLVPPSVFNLDLDYLFLNNNPFNSRLPENVGATGAAYLTLANNGFTGSIPPGIGRAGGTLIEVLLLNNQLTGCLPFEIGLLQKAVVFDAGDNLISGTIPKSFGCLRRVEQLNLARNRLYGAVPEAVCELPRLLNLSLSHNFFTELGPSCRKLAATGLLDVRGNCLEGFPQQRSQAVCAGFLAQAPCCPVVDTVPCAVPPPPSGCPVVPSPPYAALRKKTPIRRRP